MVSFFAGHYKGDGKFPALSGVRRSGAQVSSGGGGIFGPARHCKPMGQKPYGFNTPRLAAAQIRQDLLKFGKRIQFKILFYRKLKILKEF
jgi:hypothetical protein